MKVSFHVDLKEDLKGAMDIALNIPKANVKPLISLSDAEKRMFLRTLNRNRFDHDKIIFPEKIIKHYKLIFEKNKKNLSNVKQKLEKDWIKVEKTFFKKLERFLNKRFEEKIKCYIVYSYNSIGGTYADSPHVLLGYKVANIETLAHEIIHIYLHKMGKEIPKMRNENLELLTRIVEYKTLPQKRDVFLPHWIAGMSPNQSRIIDTLRTKMDFKNSNFCTILDNLRGEK